MRRRWKRRRVNWGDDLLVAREDCVLSGGAILSCVVWVLGLGLWWRAN